MDASTFTIALRAMVRLVPFQAFRIELSSGAVIEVHHPEAIRDQDGVLVHRDPSGGYSLFDCTSVTRLLTGLGQG